MTLGVRVMERKREGTARALGGSVGFSHMDHEFVEPSQRRKDIPSPHCCRRTFLPLCCSDMMELLFE
jgi:hypothetical protein